MWTKVWCLDKSHGGKGSRYSYPSTAHETLLLIIIEKGNDEGSKLTAIAICAERDQKIKSRFCRIGHLIADSQLHSPGGKRQEQAHHNCEGALQLVRDGKLASLDSGQEARSLSITDCSSGNNRAL